MDKTLKDGYIINPKTKRPVKIGSQTYNRLVKERERDAEQPPATVETECDNRHSSPDEETQHAEDADGEREREKNDVKETADPEQPPPHCEIPGKPVRRTRAQSLKVNNVIASCAEANATIMETLINKLQRLYGDDIKEDELTPDDIECIKKMIASELIKKKTTRRKRITIKKSQQVE